MTLYAQFFFFAVAVATDGGPTHIPTSRHKICRMRAICVGLSVCDRNENYANERHYIAASIIASDRRS